MIRKGVFSKDYLYSRLLVIERGCSTCTYVLWPEKGAFKWEMSYTAHKIKLVEGDWLLLVRVHMAYIALSSADY